ncbi:SlyX family protein [Rhodopirellula sp. JC740]|uniref:SlyX family protein n=1 Tax=Rhodopirellula halodulae TaxID=2894198 RepID=A0ABS8NMN9_9BACT|nr:MULTISPECIES: SlyX family protein [unclassified Rhodopirellula]MCC9644807.1 SlyX family protein [Rhodopirellula sp. JC740]MCC9658564.1 SlyX family protein [Rhodopirellula sp. JC737]
MSVEDRITELEIQLAHTQRTCDQLNEIVTQMSIDAQRRDREMSRMVGQLKDLKSKVDEQGPSLEDEKPPHY